MMKTLSEMSEAIRNPRSPDWNPVKIKLTEETTDGPPAAGWSISLQRTEDRNSTIDRTTDDSGVADFGLLHPGTYSFSLSKNRDFRSPNGSGQFNVEPGSNVKKPIVFPKKALEHVPVRVRCTWPADLEKERLVVDASFTHVPLDFDGTSWSTSSRSVLCGPGADVDGDPRTGGPLRLGDIFGTRTPRGHSDKPRPNHQRIGGAAKMGTGHLPALIELIVLRPIHAAADNAGRLQFEIIARGNPWQTNDELSASWRASHRGGFEKPGNHSEAVVCR